MYVVSAATCRQLAKGAASLQRASHFPITNLLFFLYQIASWLRQPAISLEQSR